MTPEQGKSTRPTTFVGAPADSVSRRGGTEHAPEVLRELGLPAALGASDRGDLDVRIRGDERYAQTGIVASSDVLATTATVRGALAETIAAGERPFLAGGCCALVSGALAGARDALGTVGLAYVDGHLDLYDGTTSPTGEAADMPVAVALGRGPGAWVDACGGPSIAPERTAIVGYRDQEESRRYGMLQPEELPGIISPSIDEVRVEGVAAVGWRVAEALAVQAPFWLHLDVDVLDADVFPATDYPMPGGMNWQELGRVLAPLLTSPALAGASLGCYNPEKDGPGRACGRALVEALEAGFGGGERRESTQAYPPGPAGV
jgi:arginase